MTESSVTAVVFDVGRVLFQWNLRHLFAKLIADPVELEWFVTTVVTEEWHYQADVGRPVDAMLAERIAHFPQHERLIRVYAERFNETIPGPVPGSVELVEALAARAVPLFALTNFGEEFWAGFRPTQPVFDHFADIVVSGVEKMAKPDPAIFALAAKRFGHAPPQMLFIDDNADNIASASREGWQTHLFSDAAELKVDLQARGLIG